MAGGKKKHIWKFDSALNRKLDPGLSDAEKCRLVKKAVSEIRAFVRSDPATAPGSRGIFGKVDLAGGGMKYPAAPGIVEGPGSGEGRKTAGIYWPPGRLSPI